MKLSEPLAPCTHRYKYRLFYGADGVSRVRYDNERGKGDHRHVGEEQHEYGFTTVDRLLDEELGLIERGDEGSILVPYDTVEILLPLAQVA